MKNSISKRENEEIDFRGYSYEEVFSKKQEFIWRKIGNVSILQSLDSWLKTLPALTRKNYASAFRQLFKKELIKPEISLQQFSLVNHENVIDSIKLINEWSEPTRQSRAAAYISFTAYLQRKTQGMISKALANKEGVAKTFYKTREKVKTLPLSPIETIAFLRALEKLNYRDALIAKVILQGGKRKSEVLNLPIKNVDFKNRQIRFKQSKTKGVYKETIISYPAGLLNELKSYIGNRTGLVFITKNGRQVLSQQIDRTFLKAGEIAGIQFRTTPHVLRTTLVTRLKEKQVQDSDIMKITGHVNPSQLLAYDKSNIADNASRYYNLVEE